LTEEAWDKLYDMRLFYTTWH